MNKLTVVNMGYVVGYYINDEYYSEIHENDFTSEIEDLYRGLLLKFNISEIKDLDLADEEFDTDDFVFPKQLPDLMKMNK